MWHDEGINMYAMVGDAIHHSPTLFFDLIYAFFAWLHPGVYIFAVFIVIALVCINVGPIIETSTDKSQSDIS